MPDEETTQRESLSVKELAEAKMAQARASRFDAEAAKFAAETRFRHSYSRS